MRKILFIDRDGTLIEEPKDDFQVDSLEKLLFLPHVLSVLRKIVEEFDFELVMVTNQDGLGTESFPEDTFWPAHNKMLAQLKAENIVFDAIYIDKSFEEENSANRKPQTGLVDHYRSKAFDLKSSYVIGDRVTDVEFARNLGAKSIYIGGKSDRATFSAASWEDIYSFLIDDSRAVKSERRTKETDISISLVLEAGGRTCIDTGLNFFNHMLEQISRHAGHSLVIDAKGDLEVDEHHTIEDVGILLGASYKKALSYKYGLTRYGFCLPMDEANAKVLIDFSGRTFFSWNVELRRERIGDVPCEMFEHFFRSFSESADITLHIEAYGKNEHHIIESVFKAFARALKQACTLNANDKFFPSTKGVL